MMIQTNNERLTHELYESIHINFGLNAKQYREENGNNRVRDCAHSWTINQHVLNFNDIPYLNGVSHKENFIDMILTFFLSLHNERFRICLDRFFLKVCFKKINK